MSIWIVTTGNSDVILNHDKNWGEFYGKVRNDLECKEFSQPDRIDKDKKQAGYTAPARVLGRVYENHPNSYDSDLDFPLLNTFCEYFEVNNIILERVIVLLTNQENIFQEEQRCVKKSPYWQDTHTLRPIIEWYFQQESNFFNLKPDFLELAPTSGQGLDHWNKTLSLVQDVFQQIKINPEESESVYVSHQAGTPAISSAVQFVSLNNFKEKVKFILSNQYYDILLNQESKAEKVVYQQSDSKENKYTQKAKPEEVSNATSEYRRGFQIEKAKQLIISGFPGAALEILDGIERIQPETLGKLKKMVNFFNLHSVDKDSSKDFEVDNASQRIVDSLELIEYLCKQNNYLQGVSLLAAAQETFLKTAICHEIAKINDKYRGVAVSKLLHWNNEGLSLIGRDSLKTQFKWSSDQELNIIKEEILKLLKFPVSQNYFRRYDRGEVIFKTNANNAMLEWLRKLKPGFQAWANLKWSCDYYKDRESDLRNQLMHNLRGVEDSDVIEYLLGSSETKPSDTNVMETYNNHVKTPFLKAIEVLKLPCDRTKLRKRLQEIVDSLV